MKPKPKFEGEILIWRRESTRPLDVATIESPQNVDNIIHGRIEEKYRAERICEGGQLKWVLRHDCEIIGKQLNSKGKNP